MTNDQMRNVSGNVTTTDPLVTFLYLLVRDHLPSGVVEKTLIDTAEHTTPVEFTNGWIAEFAKCAADRLRVNNRQLVPAGKVVVADDFLRNLGELEKVVTHASTELAAHTCAIRNAVRAVSQVIRSGDDSKAAPKSEPDTAPVIWLVTYNNGKNIAGAYSDWVAANRRAAEYQTGEVHSLTLH